MVTSVRIPAELSIFQGMVEKWLIQVEDIMIQSLMKVTEEAVAAYSNTPRERWVKEWPGQVCSFTSIYMNYENHNY